jgi:hypothetical protein
MDFAGRRREVKIISRSRPRRRGDVPALLLEEVEEALFARDQPEHGPYRRPGTASSRRLRARHHSTPIGISDRKMTTTDHDVDVPADVRNGLAEEVARPT